MIGLDEVGRGSWAGPVVVAAVCLRVDIGARDSKTTTYQQRISMVRDIQQHAEAIGIGWIHAKTVDAVGLQQAIVMAAQTAFSSCSKLGDDIIIDGRDNWLPDQPKARTLIKADQSEQSVAAASIIAKQLRDSYMAAMANVWPEYGFESHVGYGTKIHREAMLTHGVTALHRRSYKPVREILNATGEWQKGRS